MADPNEPLFSFTAPQFENLMETQGLSKTTKAIVEESNAMLGGTAMSYETLRDGTAPILDMLPNYSGVAPENRSLGDEEILTLFTNVEDYGKYDATEDGVAREGAGKRAFGYGVARAAPEAIVSGFGFNAGIRAGLMASSFIPPLGLPGLLAKGVVIVGGGLVGAILGATVAEETEKAVIGEKAPVVPSLEGANRGGETLAFGLSMLHSPWALSPDKIRRGGTGAVEFLSNFKNVASGKFAAEAGEKAIEMTAKNAGLSTRAFSSANKARTAAQVRGPMFGGTKGTNVLGLGKINPSGYLVDPLKGPLTGRIMSSVDTGIGKSFEAARLKKKRFLALEGAAAVGASSAAVVAQNIDAYDDGTRFLAELAGAALIPLPVQAISEKGPEAIKWAFRSLKSWRSNSGGALTSKVENDAGKRIMAGLQEAEDFTGQEQIDAFINSLMKQTHDADGNVIPGTGTAKSLSAAFGMPLNKQVGIIEDQLKTVNEELSVATIRGRDQMLISAKSAISDLIETGDPTAMAYAARLQQSLFEESIVGNLENRVSKFYTAAEDVLKNAPDGGSQQVDLSRQLYNLLDAQIKNSKTVERALWSEVKDFEITQFRAGNNRVVGTPNILKILKKPASEGGLLMKSKSGKARLDAALGSLKEDFADFDAYFNPVDGADPGANPVFSQTLIEMRQAAQDKAATFRTNGQVQMAQKMELVADTLLRDLNGVSESVDPAYQAARAYTYARNNVFTRSFLGEMQAKNKNRGYQLSPEALVEKLFRGGNRATLERINEINSAGAFGLEHFLPDAALNQASTQETIDLVIRDSLRKVMDKKPVLNPVTREPTGAFEYVVNPTKLETFKKQPGTQELFSVFPNLANDLATAESARNLQRAADNELTSLGKSLQTTAFQNVLAFADKPVEAVAKAISSRSPAKSLMELVNLAKQTPKGIDEVTQIEFTSQDALKGLRNSIFDYVTIHSGGSGLMMNPTKFEVELFGQIKGVPPSIKMSLMDVMRDNGMIEPKEIANIQKAIKQMRGVEEAFSTGDLENVLFKKPTLQKLMFTKMLGATLGQKMQEQLNKTLQKIGLGTEGGGIGGGMIAAQTGSDAIQQAILRGPESLIVKSMSNFFAHPELLGPMLKEISTKQQADEAMKALSEGFAAVARQAGRRLPYATRYITDEDDNTVADPVVEPVIEEVVAPSVTPIRPLPKSLNLPVPIIEQGSLMPTGAPTPNVGSAPLSIQQASAAPGPTIQNSGPVDRERFAALFPNDSTTQLMKSGIGSLA